MTEKLDHAITQILEYIQSLLAQARTSAIEGIGVSCGSPLDRNLGLIQSPPNLPTWIDVPITSILENAFGAPCRLENDADAGAVASIASAQGVVQTK